MTVGPPEGFDENILGRARIPDNLQDPAIHLGLELPKERFERVLITSDKALEEIVLQLVRHDRLPCLTWEFMERFR